MDQPMKNWGDALPPEYYTASEILRIYVTNNHFTVSTLSSDTIASLHERMEDFAPERLKSLEGDELLTTLFYTQGDNSRSLCYWLEMDKVCKEQFGNIAGGSISKFGFFQDKDTGEWMASSASKNTTLSPNDALILGTQIRDALVAGAQTINEFSPLTAQDFDELDAQLKAQFQEHLGEKLGEQLYSYSWVHKYYSVFFRDKLSSFHSDKWQYHVLRALRIKPSSTYYGRSGQIALIQNVLGWSYKQFFDIFLARFGKPITFIRLGSRINNVHVAEVMEKKGVVAIGWEYTGDLNALANPNGTLESASLKTILAEAYTAKNIISRLADDICRFYNAGDDTVFVVMSGEDLVAFADHLGPYVYKADDGPMPNQRPATWRRAFLPKEKLPYATEGKQTTCTVLSKPENIDFLYERYFYPEMVSQEASSTISVNDAGEKKTSVTDPIRYRTGFSSSFERNRILFGAPGTGKSFTLNQEAKTLLGDLLDTHSERVTFHPDYSYAQFVGAYKPVPSQDAQGNETITYAFVPGPFMRMLVKALKSSQKRTAEPHLLLIEEINRANMAAVFGDIFQLLDRDADGVSEYPIGASEDMKRYLARELGGKPDDYYQLRLPDNLFIWATMNSADQGVFPMDTAFKRRWDFTYLGIDASDREIQGKFVTLGSVKPHRVEWNALRKAINDFLAKEKINEDKQLGPYFIGRSIVVPRNGGTEMDPIAFSRVFKHKVLMYLFEDACRQKRNKLFEGYAGGVLRYSTLCDEFDQYGVDIFHTDIQSRVPRLPLEDSSADDLET